MNSTKFLSLSSGEKKKVVKSAVQGANKDQKALIERYRKLEKVASLSPIFNGGRSERN